MEYVFFGRISPSFRRIEFGIKDPPLRFSVESSIGRFDYKLLLNNTDDLSVVVETAQEITDVLTLHFLVRQLTQSFYDTAFFNSGIICTVSFSSVLLPNNVFAGLNIGDLSKWIDTTFFDFEIEKLFRLKNDSAARVATSDIKNACIEYDMTAFYSFRAIEGIMNSFNVDDKENRKISWDKLRDNLNIDRVFFSDVEKYSISNRHGKPFEQTISIRKKSIYSAMIVLQRYMHFLDGGRNKLDQGKFPTVFKIEDIIKSFINDI